MFFFCLSPRGVMLPSWVCCCCSDRDSNQPQQGILEEEYNGCHLIVFVFVFFVMSTQARRVFGMQMYWLPLGKDTQILFHAVLQKSPVGALLQLKYTISYSCSLWLKRFNSLTQKHEASGKHGERWPLFFTPLCASPPS